MDFIVVSSYRSGSTWFCRSLDSHSQVRCAGEIFHPDPEVSRHALHQLRRPRPRALGFKITYRQIESLPDWQTHLEGKAILHLVRNPLSCVLSAREARSRGVWHRSPATRTKPTPPQLLPLPWLRDQIQEIEKWQRRIRAWGENRDYFEVAYENLCSGPWPPQLWEFLGVPPETLRTTTEPWNPGPLSQRIRNYDWLAMNLGDSGYLAST